MKKNLFTFCFALSLLLGATSCKQYFGEINENPNDPTEVPVDVLLSGLEVQLNFVNGGEFSRNTSLLMQQTEEVLRSWWIPYRRITATSNHNRTWNVNLYENHA